MSAICCKPFLDAVKLTGVWWTKWSCNHRVGRLCM